MPVMSNIALIPRRRGVYGAFNPLTDLSGTLEFWGKQSYDITSSPDIDEWNDASGNGNDADQGTAAKKPHLVSSGIGSTDVADYDGTDDYMDAGLSYQATFRTNHLIGMVVKLDDGQPAARSVLFGVKDAGSSNEVRISVETDGTIFVRTEYNNNVSAFISNDSFSNGAQSAIGLLVWHDFTGGAIKVRLVTAIINAYMAANGVGDGDLSGLTIEDYTSNDNPYFMAQNNQNAAGDERHTAGYLGETFIESSATEADVLNWAQRFQNILNG